MDKLKIFVYGDPESFLVIKLCVEMLKGKPGIEIVSDITGSDVAVAPCLTKILKINEIQTPALGTLIFHPSLLPLRRGPDAIKWAFFYGDNVSGGSWFWADKGIDSGDVCEQLPIPIGKEETPKAFYFNKVIPAAVLMLSDIIEDLLKGVIRKRKQNDQYKTYEGKFVR